MGTRHEDDAEAMTTRALLYLGIAATFVLLIVVLWAWVKKGL
jgi:hypothetical protein